jgi:WD40 repeat protein
MLTGHGDWVRAVAVSPDGRRAVTASNDRTHKVWELESGRELQTLSGHAGWVRGAGSVARGFRLV